MVHGVSIRVMQSGDLQCLTRNRPRFRCRPCCGIRAAVRMLVGRLTAAVADSFGRYIIDQEIPVRHRRANHCNVAVPVRGDAETRVRGGATRTCPVSIAAAGAATTSAVRFAVIRSLVCAATCACCPCGRGTAGTSAERGGRSTGSSSFGRAGHRVAAFATESMGELRIARPGCVHPAHVPERCRTPICRAVRCGPTRFQRMSFTVRRSSRIAAGVRSPRADESARVHGGCAPCGDLADHHMAAACRRICCVESRNASLDVPPVSPPPGVCSWDPGLQCRPRRCRCPHRTGAQPWVA